jgi:hypothetical protein
MKFFELIILLCLILFSYQRCRDGQKKEDCKLSDEDKEDGDEYCCFVEDGDDKNCVGLTKYQYKHIKDFAKLQRLQGVASEDSKIDCKSLYLQISLLSILLLLL